MCLNKIYYDLLNSTLCDIRPGYNRVTVGLTCRLLYAFLTDGLEYSKNLTLKSLLPEARI